MQTIDVLIQRWQDLRINGEVNAHQLYDASHPLQLFFGYDVSGARILFLITPTAPKHLPVQSESIELKLLQRHDGLFTLMIRLLKPDQDSVFNHLCWDLAEFTRTCHDNATGSTMFLERYRKWQRLLERGRLGILSEAEIKGLIGELLFLEKYLFKRYGMTSALKGWLGPSGADQDFRFEDFWYEIKTTDPGALTVRISSLEQLDIDKLGQLCIVLLDKAGNEINDAISLNSVVANIRNLISADLEAIHIFEQRLDAIGYIDSREYSEDIFVLRNIRRFLVDYPFPRIRRSMIASSISRVTYDVNVDDLAPFEIH
ncbi:PD-(D/E)XK motif protein [Dehalococcoides mccartyi]|jgi:hypothetical protein|uniref:PD-(D/E)XK motif protein n=1 Tax=Dehalococcoides mccartyi TaxID=61435 RepID=A0A328ERT2_9CHLR|nr:PD-(D/E)XK motif protein [Dehalococcoides mccartyi]AII61630.1 hypothetical protein X794_00385 [Dehalococcoides mccartyi CG5]RAL68866.1 hypothetical protein C1G87_1639 [Dehalococcoides mccartyi]RAL70079.1 hypothetical protein C1G86_1610 [Dehalococcoides mccartyi]